jgi:ribosomal protein S24E
VATDIKIEVEKDNPFLNRKEMVGFVEHEKDPTPSKAVIQKLLADKKKVKPEFVEVCNIYTLKGENKSKIVAKVWKDKEFPNLMEVAKQKAAEKAEKIKEEEEKTVEEEKKEEPEEDKVEKTEEEAEKKVEKKETKVETKLKVKKEKAEKSGGEKSS